MKKSILYITLIVFLTLVACSSSAQVSNGSDESQAVSNSPSANGTPAPVGQSQERELPPVLKMALATFKLEDTKYPIDAQQAQALLPLWKAYRSLSNSETTAGEEIQAVINQIEKTLTKEQTQTIEEMNISYQDMGTIAQSLGLDIANRGAGFGNMDPEMQATIQAALESGQMPQGGFGGGPGFGMGGGPGEDAGLSPEARQTAIANQSDRSSMRAGAINPLLLDALIELLQTRAEG